jgi:uncharacterized SAM-binding protein YcdF (DUF218 family)
MMRCKGVDYFFAMMLRERVLEELVRKEPARPSTASYPGMRRKRKPFAGVLFLALGLGCGFLVFAQIGNWLAVADEPAHVDMIICLSGSQERIDKAAQLIHQGFADRILVTHTDVHRMLLAQHVSPEKIIAPSWKVRSTYQEGLLVHDFVERNYRSFMVVSDPYHLYRVRWTMRHHFGDLDSNFIFVASEAVGPPGFWWSTQDGRRYVLSEVPKIFYYWLWHGLLDNDVNPPWALEVKDLYLAFIYRFF